MESRQRRSLLRSPILAGVLAVLSMSVFSWGLAYKLSLYRSHQSSSRMVAAKLLSEKERPGTAMSRKVVPPGPALFAYKATGRNSAPADFTHIPEPQIHFGLEQLFTVHTGRKPPPNAAG